MSLQQNVVWQLSGSKNIHSHLYGFCLVALTIMSLRPEVGRQDGSGRFNRRIKQELFLPMVICWLGVDFVNLNFFTIYYVYLLLFFFLSDFAEVTLNFIFSFVYRQRTKGIHFESAWSLHLEEHTWVTYFQHGHSWVYSVCWVQ